MGNGVTTLKGVKMVFDLVKGVKTGCRVRFSRSRVGVATAMVSTVLQAPGSSWIRCQHV
jgi:hypothetical protein